MFFRELKRFYETDLFTPEEFALLNNAVQNNSYVRNKVETAVEYIHTVVAEWNGYGLQIPVHLVENFILRHILTGLKNGTLPTDTVLPGETREYKGDVDAYGRYEIERNEGGFIISHENPDDRKTKWLEVDNVAFKFKTNIYRYVLDTEFEELLPEEVKRETILENQIDSLSEENSVLKAQVENLNELLDLSEDEKDRLKDSVKALDKVVQDLNKEMTEQAEEFQETLKEQSESSADAIKALADNLQEQIEANEKKLEDLRKEQQEQKNKKDSDNGTGRSDTGNRTIDNPVEEDEPQEDLKEEIDKNLSEDIITDSDTKLQDAVDDITLNISPAPPNTSLSIREILESKTIDSETKQSLLATKSTSDYNERELERLIQKVNAINNDMTSVSQNDKMKFTEKIQELKGLKEDRDKTITEIRNLLGDG